MNMKKNKAPLPQLRPENSLIDTHCHLDMDAYAGDLDEVVRSAAAKGVARIITVGINLESSIAAVAIARRFANVWSTIGLHPHNADAAEKDTFDRLARLVENPDNKVAGYGEIGLDYAKKYAPQDAQHTAFSAQLDLAKALDLPVIIHDRDAHADTMRILRQFAPFPAGGVMHCFSGDMELARQVIELGFFVSIPGIVTFNKSNLLQEVAREIPLERMILETDGPFLAPVPFRGRPNRPEYVLYTAGKIAELRGIAIDKIAQVTTCNAELLFRLNTGRPAA